MSKENAEWNETEFEEIKLGDERLNVRAIKLLGQLRNVSITLRHLGEKFRL
jgi:Transposase DNA-binding